MSKIEWTGKTLNPISGCSRKSAGCENCYAEVMTKRLAAMGQEKYQGLLNTQDRFNGVMKFDEKALLKPLSVKTPTTYFVNSMSDLFHENCKDEWIDKFFAVAALCPQHTFQVLTKRPERMSKYFTPEALKRIAASVYNVMYGQRKTFTDNDSIGRVGNRQSRAHLAHCEAWRKSAKRFVCDSPVSASSSGIPTEGGLSADNVDFQREKSCNGRASLSLGALQRTNSGDDGNQSQERHQERQSPDKSGIGDILNEPLTRDRSSEYKSPPSDGKQEPENPFDGRGCFGNSQTSIKRSNGQGYSSTIQDSSESCICHLPSQNLETHLTLPLPNVWLGVSVENQKTADERIPLLLQTPAAVRFLSCEPLLEETDIAPYLSLKSNDKGEIAPEGDCLGYNLPSIHWTIVGGESGNGARPCAVEWIQSLIYQCRDTGTKVFVKQLGAFPVAENCNYWDFPEHVKYLDYGDKAASARFVLKNKKGGDIENFPKGLQIREMPG